MIPLLVGFLMGCIGSIPPTGPISVLVLTRALQGRTMAALAVALGGALPETAYAGLALWGVGRLVTLHPWLRWTGPVLAVTVVILSVRDLRRGQPWREPAADRKQRWQALLEPRRGLLRCLLLGFITAAINVTMLFTWGAVASFLHGAAWLARDLEPLWLMPIGVFFGIIVWMAAAIAVANRIGAKHLTVPPQQSRQRG